MKVSKTLVSPPQTSDILRRMDSVLKSISEGAFPFPEILEGQAVCRQLGW